MRYTFNSSDVEPRQRPAYWQDAVCRSFLNVSCAPMRAGPVSGSISLKVLGQVRAARFSCSPHEFVRSRAELAGNADEHLLLDIQLRGVNKLRQRERDLVTVRHQGHIYSSWAPFRNLVDGGGAPADLMVLMVPARSVISRLPPAAIFAASPSRSTTLWARHFAFCSMRR